MHHARAVWAALAALVISLLAVVSSGLSTLPASATDTYTVNGNHSTGCAVLWNASARLSYAAATELGLDAGEYSNHGYLTEVSSFTQVGGESPDPGLMEMQHFFVGNTAYWRVPIGTDLPMQDVRVVLPLPTGYSGYTPSGYFEPTKAAVYSTEVPLSAGDFEVVGNRLVVTVGDMPAMSRAIFQVTAEVPDAATYDGVQSAALTPTYPAGVGDCPASAPSVDLTKTAEPTTVAPGDTVTYTLTATNHGGEPTSVLVLTDPVPAGISVMTVSPSPECGLSGQLVTCELPPLAPGESTTVTITGLAQGVVDTVPDQHLLAFDHLDASWSLAPGETGTFAQTCPADGIVTDVSVLVSNVDAGTGTIASVETVMSGATSPSTGSVTLTNHATGQAQGHLVLMCLQPGTVDGQSHGHDVVTAPVVTSTTTLSSGLGTVTMPVPDGTVPVAPSYTVESGSARLVGSELTVDGWAFTFDVADGGATVTTAVTPLSTRATEAGDPAHTPLLEFTHPQQTVTVPVGTSSWSVSCPEGYKSVTATFDGPAYVGSEARPVTREFQLYNPGPEAVQQTIDSVCLRERLSDTQPTSATLTNTAAVTVDSCPEWVLGGHTVFPVSSTDVTVRQKFGDGGETNADGWGSGTTRALRLYGATDRTLTDVTFVATANQGFTFAADSVGAVITGQPAGMGALYGNGYTNPVAGAGTPQISADGRTVTLHVDRMPAGSAFAFGITAALDGTRADLVVTESLRGAPTTCPANLDQASADVTVTGASTPSPARTTVSAFRARAGTVVGRVTAQRDGVARIVVRRDGRVLGRAKVRVNAGETRKVRVSVSKARLRGAKVIVRVDGKKFRRHIR